MFIYTYKYFLRLDSLVVPIHGPWWKLFSPDPSDVFPPASTHSSYLGCYTLSTAKKSRLSLFLLRGQASFSESPLTLCMSVQNWVDPLFFLTVIMEVWDFSFQFYLTFQCLQVVTIHIQIYFYALWYQIYPQCYWLHCKFKEFDPFLSLSLLQSLALQY